MQPKATVFSFTYYKFEPEKKRILFHYKMEFEDKNPLFFTETILLPKIPRLNTIPKNLVKKLLEDLHIILGISYYKLYCAPKLAFGKPGSRSQSDLGTTKITIPYALSKKEAEFWSTVYKKGLGEFFYKNNLDPKVSPIFPFSNSVKAQSFALPKSNRHLVGVGGGKDSIVSIELLKNNFDITGFVVKTNKESNIIDSIIETAGIKQLKIKRILDENIFNSHQYRGHIPISAMYAFLGVFAAVIYDYSSLIVSNEYSSNFGNVRYKGEMINHQWSKSFEFEALLQNYLKEFITPDVTYFSLLRSFYEIRIVKMFSKLKKYFPYFSSCNKNFTARKQNDGKLWCGECPKCVFVFTVLSAFLSKKALLDIFKKNVYEDKNLLPTFKDILGLGSMKPFDCVGTFEEAQTALFLARKKFKDTFIVRQLGKHAKYDRRVFTTIHESLVPEQFKFLGIKNVLILGYGKEGKVTHQYLKKQYPKLNIGITDAKEGREYLKKQRNYDLAIKTPGIHKKLVTIPYTTATNIFFYNILGKHIIIGVTGSKGKSTTSSLIYHIIKTAGKNVELLGNIGMPMVKTLLHPVPKDRIFVLELSSFQLDDIKFSPDIAVVTNLFPEHMDFHDNLQNYYNAKKNIINLQNENNYFVYNPNNKTMVTWLKDYKGNVVPFSKKPLVSNLIGQHNKSNIGAAMAVAQILKIPPEKIKKAVKSFKGLPHRLEFVGTYKGITFYDDAISTTPESTIMAIESLKNVDTIFLGGEDRGYNFLDLEKTIKKYTIRNIVLFPKSGSRMLTSKKGFNILQTSSMKQAVTFALKNTKEGRVCLLSCASPSYSLWKNFEEKGNEFKKMIRTHLKNTPPAI